MNYPLSTSISIARPVQPKYIAVPNYKLKVKYSGNEAVYGNIHPPAHIGDRIGEFLMGIEVSNNGEMEIVDCLNSFANRTAVNFGQPSNIIMYSKRNQEPYSMLLARTEQLITYPTYIVLGVRPDDHRVISEMENNLNSVHFINRDANGNMTTMPLRRHLSPQSDSRHIFEFPIPRNNWMVINGWTSLRVPVPANTVIWFDVFGFTQEPNREQNFPMASAQKMIMSPAMIQALRK